jgi:hypothetical protein
MVTGLRNCIKVKKRIYMSLHSEVHWINQKYKKNIMVL